MKLKAYFMALRPRQWTKNLIVFAAPLFAFNISIQSLFASFLAFILFCLASSSFYLFNDIADREADRLHPVKCKRPIAAGLVDVNTAMIMAIFFLVTAITIGWLKAPSLGMTILGYAILQIAYNLRLKQTVILDVIAIATGFVLRATAGATATGIILSPWFMLCTAMLALFLGIEKRKAELRLLQLKGGKTRAVLRRYSLGLLHRMENIVSSTAIMTYALWTSGPSVKGASTPWMMVTIPFVLYGIFRYQFLSDPEQIARRKDIKEEKSERPEEILLQDRPILITVVSWILSIFIILSLEKHGII
jgi:4-hydroxybenzoate polyprenyltransferase